LSINKNIRQLTKARKEYSTEEILAGILSKDITFLSIAITLVESSRYSDKQKAHEIIDACLPYSGKSKRIGITGVPGVGKSTFIESFGQYLIKEKKKKVAVLAVDPSSNRNRGSILGDKTRMETLSNLKGAYIRPSPSMGSLGGVSKATRETIILCEAAGFDTILIETVGVGQSEVEVKSMVDFFLLLMLAGAGDELQGIKRGIMEMADLLVINKAEGDNLKPARRARTEYKNALHLFPASRSGWIPKVETCSALESSNIDLVYNITLQYFDLIEKNGFFDEQRKGQALEWYHKALENEIVQQFMQNESNKIRSKELEKLVIDGKRSPFSAVDELIKKSN
jgi:LAO/AO transport system kinase